MSLKMGHVESKTRSMGQILEKPCVHFRGYVFSLILFRLGQNVCFGDVFQKSLIMGNCQVQN